MTEKEKRALVHASEAHYRDGIAAVTEAVRAHRSLRFVALAGPTCSGKTTTARLLKDALKQDGRRVVMISIDDFFYDRATLAAEAEKRGEPFDMDSVKAIDLPSLRAFLCALHEGRPALLPHFDFERGKQTSFSTLLPEPQDIYLFEGIQAVYPEVVSLFPVGELLRLYLSVERSLATPCGLFPPREQRLLRRLLRDSKFRATDPETTLTHWGSVVRNELSHIEPNRGGVDLTVDSSLPYELCVMKEELIPLLSSVGEGSDHATVARLLCERLTEFPVIDRSLVPRDSVLREFIGE